MDDKALFLKFWNREAAATRKVISRIPQDRSDYRPEPRSRNARDIAWLIVQEEIALAEGLERGTFTWAETPTPADVKDIVGTYDRNHESVSKRLGSLSSEQWQKQMPFVVGDQEVMRETGSEMAWGFFFDIIHHRGQLSTYLRPMGAKVPSIYGPSADEQS
jgi:uncharacterized damage-inducible protein DinB